MINRVIKLLLCLSIATTCSFANPINVTIYADENYPPYSYNQYNSMQGIYTEILSTAFAKMKNYNVEIVPLPWKRALKLIETGQAFAIYPPYFHIVERPYIWPYSLPLLDEQVIVICREVIFKKSSRPNWPEDYYGLKIGNNAGFQLGGDKFWHAVKKGKITVSEAKGNRENLLMLGLGRTDCYMNDKLSILWELKQLKLMGEYDENGKHAKLAEGVTISIEQGFLGYTATNKYPFKDDFKKQLDSVLYDMRRNGQIQKIINSYVN